MLKSTTLTGKAKPALPVPQAAADVGETQAERLQAHYDALGLRGVTLRLSQYWQDETGGEVELENLEARPRGKGRGTLAMQHLVRLADLNRVNLMLIVAGRPGTVQHSRLVRFYERFGFEMSGGCDDDIMRRTAR